ncbi:MAG: hypothetical protein M0R46_00825 [Candidatus Muirbacterium halophilum]|nr:hypothetical protein [Candidatus Muirbacterium halophilum]MCK9474437.1 hypothetical protein [Candidatus Muirbacterium halophilum]
MNILGISCYYHDSSACLICNDKVFAVSEERFNRQKHSAVFPEKSIEYCINSAKINFNDIDYVIFHEKPFLKFNRVLENFIITFPYSYKNFMNIIPRYLGERLIISDVFKKKYKYKGEFLYNRHHLSHAASAFFPSKFEKSIIMTCDGLGEYSTMTSGYGINNKIYIENELSFPNSLGMLYSAITSYLGFLPNGGEGKVMALADFGEAEFLNKLKEIVKINSDGSFSVNEDYFDFRSGNSMFTSKFVKKFGKGPKKLSEISQKHKNIASSLQALTEEIILNNVNILYSKHKVKNLCAAGGVFLNCVTNGKILRNTPIENIFIQPAAGDSGTALGACLYLYNQVLENPRNFLMDNTFLGPEYSNKEIENMLICKNIKFEFLNDKQLFEKTSDLLIDNKIIGWFQGRMEFGPRALGNRSILANPQNPKMKDILNEKVKHREWFRPFGISILHDKADVVIKDYIFNQFMLITGNVKEEWKSKIPSAIHIDGSTRYQSVNNEQIKYYSLIERFYEKTKVPLIINTSFNDNKEPIVCNPEDAFNCFVNTEIDVLVLGNYMVKKL